MSVKTKATFSSSIFNKDIFTKSLRAKLSAKHKQSVRVWLRRVLEETPVYTGTVKGTFKPVHRLVDNVKFTSVPNKTGKKYFIYQGRKVPLGFEKGADYAHADMNEQEIGYAIEYSFFFQRDLLYAMWNEMQPAPSWIKLKNPTPWEAILKANWAWARYVREDIFKKLPRLSHTLKITKLRVR